MYRMSDQINRQYGFIWFLSDHFCCYNLLCIKTHDSESRGQEETAIIRETKNTRPLSELFTRKSVKKLTNALVKPQ